LLVVLLPYYPGLSREARHRSYKMYHEIDHDFLEIVDFVIQFSVLGAARGGVLCNAKERLHDRVD